MVGFDREFCLCGVHVHSATKVIAITFLVFSGISFLNDLVEFGRRNYEASSILLILIGHGLGASINIALL
jgi:hypothetical protein